MEAQLRSRDKAGYNFSILVAQIILLVNIRDTDKLFNMKQSFRLYMHHYIKKNKHPRHFYFGRMVRLLFSDNINPTIAGQKVKPYLNDLKEQKSKLHILEETEVIPYEVLWQMLMEKFVKK